MSDGEALDDAALIDDIEERGVMLNSWEAGFMESAVRGHAKYGRVTERQREILERIHEERVPE